MALGVLAVALTANAVANRRASRRLSTAIAFALAAWFVWLLAAVWASTSVTA